MKRSSCQRRLRHFLTAVVVASLLVAGCSDDHPKKDGDETAPPPTATRDCGDFRIAYDPTNGYEASAFIVGTLASEHLDCHVTYVKTTSHDAWRLVASGAADVYLDAYGNGPQRARLTGPGRPVTLVGRNGVRGVVNLMAPYFMKQRGLDTSRDLPDVERIGWGLTTPAITTVPALLPLANSFVEFQRIDYVVRNANRVGVGTGMASLLTQAAQDELRQVPNLYLVEGPATLLADDARQTSVQVPGSAAEDCVPSRTSTLCSLGDFHYQKIANTEFAGSGSPAYSLVFKYSMNEQMIANISELIVLSGYHVGTADVASWINTHPKVWRRWLP